MASSAGSATIGFVSVGVGEVCVAYELAPDKVFVASVEVGLEELYYSKFIDPWFVGFGDHAMDGCVPSV